MLFSSSCQSDPPDGLEVYRAYALPHRPPRDPFAVEVKVSTARQRVYVLERERLLLAMPVTVGAPESPTPQGSFRIRRKAARRVATDYGFRIRGDEIEKCYRDDVPEGWRFVGRPMRYWCEFAPGLGFHAGWIKHLPSSDGCIRVHQNLAPKFYDLVQPGTPVEIRPTHPEDARYGLLPLPPDAGPFPEPSPRAILEGSF